MYWKKKAKEEEEGDEGYGKAVTRKQNLEQTRQDKEKVVTLNYRSHKTQTMSGVTRPSKMEVYHRDCRNIICHN